MRKSRKRVLAESLSENQDSPDRKRTRRFDPSESESVVGTSGNSGEVRNFRRRRRRLLNRQLSSSSSTEGVQRKRNNSEVTAVEHDENDITELSHLLKRARLRPTFFTISSFIEQTVGDVSVTVGEEDGDSSVSSSTFTFVLPVTTSSSEDRGDDHDDRTYCGTHGHTNEEET